MAGGGYRGENYNGKQINNKQEDPRTIPTIKYEREFIGYMLHALVLTWE